jgi:hypothetical protein
MVESPETTAYVPVDSIEPADPPAYEAAPKPADEQEPLTDPEILLVQKKPVTSSLRGTILHLRQRAGYWSRFRGLSMYMVWNIGGGLLVGLFTPITRNRLVLGLVTILVQVLLSRYIMTWIHIVISDPSPKRWYQRLPPLRRWSKMAPAVALWATCNQIVAIMPMLVCGYFGSLNHMKDPDYQPDKKDLYAVAGQGFMGMFIMLALFVGLQIPATVTMVRVAASQLPEEDETIVSFDRTFGGKVTPAILGGQGKVGIVEAWRSFPRSSRLRLLRLLAKVVLVIMALWIAMIVCLTAEAHLLLGDSLGHVMKAIHGAAGPR